MQSIEPTASIRLGSGKHAVALALGLAVAGARLIRRSLPGPAASRHALILEPYGLGDAISLVPLVHGLLRHGWKVTLCARAPWRDLFPPAVEWIDSRVPWASYDDHQKYKPGSLAGPEMRALISQIRQQAGGAVGLDTRGDVRSLGLLWISGCSRVLSLSQYLGCDLTVPPWAAERVPADPSRRRWQSNLAFLSALCPETEVRPFSLDLRDRWPRIFENPPDPAIGLIPLAPWLGKSWPDDSWRSLVSQLRAAGWSVRGLAGPGQHEAVTRALGIDTTDVVSCGSLEAWAGQLARVRGVVSVDTGPMHLADALHIPLVALYGSGTLPLWAPSNPRSLALHRQMDPDYAPVHPTSSAVAPGQAFMRRHSAEAVMSALTHVVGPRTV